MALDYLYYHQACGFQCQRPRNAKAGDILTTCIWCGMAFKVPVLVGAPGSETAVR